MRPSPFNSVVLGALCLAAAAAQARGQTPGSRVSYRARVLERVGADTPRVLASGAVRGPEETNLRLTVVTDTTEVETLLDVIPEPDTVYLAGAFHARRRVGRSSRGLGVWEVDDYRRAVRFPWGGTVRLYPFGMPGKPRDQSVWIELTIAHDLVGGSTRPEEALTVFDSTVRVTMEAVVRPRRAAVRLTLFRGDTASAPQVFEMVADAPGRLVKFMLGRAESRSFEVTLVSPDPPLTTGDSATGAGADVLCLRVLDPASSGSPHVRCGRLNNVARRLPLSDRDTLLATFAWPAPR